MQLSESLTARRNTLQCVKSMIVKRLARISPFTVGKPYTFHQGDFANLLAHKQLAFGTGLAYIFVSADSRRTLNSGVLKMNMQIVNEAFRILWNVAYTGNDSQRITCMTIIRYLERNAPCVY